jgi:hypothetical protein
VRYGGGHKEPPINPQRIIGLVLLIAGIALLVTGIIRTDSFGEQASKFFTGSFSDKAMWQIVGGIVLILVGGGVSGGMLGRGK